MSDSTEAPTGEQAMEAALRRFGWTCGPDFWQRYHSDPWVFNLANAVERLTAEIVVLQLAADASLANTEADQ